MTVGELKKLLEEYDDDERVQVSIRDDSTIYEVHNVVEYFDGDGDAVYLESYP